MFSKNKRNGTDTDHPTLQTTERTGNWNCCLWSEKELALGGDVNVIVRKRLDNLSISVVWKDNSGHWVSLKIKT